MKLLNQKLAAIICASLALILAGCVGTRQRQSTGEYIDSRALNVKVKTALLNDSEVKGMAIDVDVWRAVVQLNGFVDTEEQRQRAEDVAWGVGGVRSVQNNLVVKNELLPEDLGASARVEAQRDPVGSPGTARTGAGASAEARIDTSPRSGPGLEAQARVGQSGGAEINLQRLAESPREYYGQQARVRGRVLEVLSPNAFTLSAGNEQRPAILVIGAGGAVPALRPGDQVQVSGMVREFEATAVEREFNLTLNDRLAQDWRQRPALIARSIDLANPRP